MWLHYSDQSEAQITATDQSEASIIESGHRWENAFSNISESHLGPVACGGCICLINISLDRDCHLVCKYTSLSSLSIHHLLSPTFGKSKLDQDQFWIQSSNRELGSLKWFSLYFGMDYWWGQFYIILSFITQLALARTPFVSLLEFFVRLNLRAESDPGLNCWIISSLSRPLNINMKCCHNTRRRVIKISLHTKDVIPGQVADVSSEASLHLIFPVPWHFAWLVWFSQLLRA